MQIDIKAIGDVIIYLAAVVAALGAIWGLAKLVILRPLKKWLAEQVAAPVRAIHHEVTPNSGGSMADAVTRVQESVSELKSALDTHMKETSPRGWAIQDLARRFDDHLMHHHHTDSPAETDTP